LAEIAFEDRPYRCGRSTEHVVTTTETSKATIAGMLDIAAGVFGLFGGFVLLIIGLVASGVLGATLPPELTGLVALPLALFLPLAGMHLVAAAFAITGGFAALQRRKGWLAVCGAVAALVCFFPLGILAMIFTVLAEREFVRPDAEKGDRSISEK
jgi:hypothetical protein